MPMFYVGNRLVDISKQKQSLSQDSLITPRNAGFSVNSQQLELQRYTPESIRAVHARHNKLKEIQTPEEFIKREPKVVHHFDQAHSYQHYYNQNHTQSPIVNPVVHTYPLHNKHTCPECNPLIKCNCPQCNPLKFHHCNCEMCSPPILRPPSIRIQHQRPSFIHQRPSNYFTYFKTTSKECLCDECKEKNGLSKKEKYLLVKPEDLFQEDSLSLVNPSRRLSWFYN